LQQLVVLLKVDMTSLLGVQITYQDNDGDWKQRHTSFH
jgi:hypothetical protein